MKKSQNQFTASISILTFDFCYISAIARNKKADSSLKPSNAVIAIAEERVGTERAKDKSNLARLPPERESLIQRQIQIKD